MTPTWLTRSIIAAVGTIAALRGVVCQLHRSWVLGL